MAFLPFSISRRSVAALMEVLLKDFFYLNLAALIEVKYGIVVP